MQKLFALVILSLLVITVPQPAQSAAGEYRVTQTLAVGGDDGWDYVAVDSAARHVFVSHGTHVVVLDWVRRGVLDGLRVDHPDGLRNPKQYVERLHETVVASCR